MSYKNSKIFRGLISRRKKAWLVIENMQALCLLPYPPVPMMVPLRPGMGRTLPTIEESFEETAKRAMKDAQATIKEEEILEEEWISAQTVATHFPKMESMRTRPRQMWELDPEVEKSLASRSFWVRGLGLGGSKEEVVPLLERTGQITQRVRIYKLDGKDGFGEFAVYVTYGSKEDANLNMTRLRTHSHGHHALMVMEAKREGAYRRQTQQMKERMILRNLTKEDKKQIVKKKETKSKVEKIRERLKSNGMTGSPASDSGSKPQSAHSTPQKDKFRELLSSPTSEGEGKRRISDQRNQKRKESSGSPAIEGSHRMEHSKERSRSDYISDETTLPAAYEIKNRVCHPGERGRSDYISDERTLPAAYEIRNRAGHPGERGRSDYISDERTLPAAYEIRNRAGHPGERGRSDYISDERTLPAAYEIRNRAGHPGERGRSDYISDETTLPAAYEIKNRVCHPGERGRSDYISDERTLPAAYEIRNRAGHPGERGRSDYISDERTLPAEYEIRNRANHPGERGRSDYMHEVSTLPRAYFHANRSRSDHSGEQRQVGQAWREIALSPSTEGRSRMSLPDQESLFNIIRSEATAKRGRGSRGRGHHANRGSRVPVLRKELSESPSDREGSPPMKEASPSKKNLKRKRKNIDEPSTSHRDEVDLKRIRSASPVERPISRERKEKEERMERRGPRTPPSPDIIDSEIDDEHTSFLPRAESPRPSQVEKKRRGSPQKMFRGAGRNKRR